MKKVPKLGSVIRKFFHFNKAVDKTSWDSSKDYSLLIIDAKN